MVFNDIVSESIRRYWDKPCMEEFCGEKKISYAEMGHTITYFHTIFKNSEIGLQEHIAIVGHNSINWCVSYLSIVTFGAVVVPIAPELKSDDIGHLIQHSDSVLLFVERSILKTLSKDILDQMKCVIVLDDIEIVNNEHFHKDFFSLPVLSESLLYTISYTSGTSEFARGVMLSHRSLQSNIKFSQQWFRLGYKDKMVSILPFYHSYGCVYNFIYPFITGSFVLIMDTIPSPSLLIKTLKNHSPKLFFSVPLVIEKLISEIIKRTNFNYYEVELLSEKERSILHRAIMEIFGNKLNAIIFGGAPLPLKTESILRSLNIPFYTGYGMTECGPSISCGSNTHYKPGSVGLPAAGLEIKINPIDDNVGEICVRGDYVMKGYYKDDAENLKVIDSDRWLHTGDLGYIDSDGYIFLVGRCKNVILNSSGKNIYPEEIEYVIRNYTAVKECIVFQKDDKITALIYLEDADENDAVLTEFIKVTVNKHLPKYMQISEVILQKQPFDKTPKKSIIRHLYV